MKALYFTIALLIATTVSNAQSIANTLLRLPDTGATSGYTTTFGEDNDYNFFVPYFTLNGNGTVTDTITGLMWQQTDGGEMTIENAITYCSNLTLGGYTDWRLPNAHEAFSILNQQYANPSLDNTVFTTTLAEYWWSIDRQANDSNKVWATNAGGGIGNHPKTETISAGGPKRFHARAVRTVHTPVVLTSKFIDNGDGTLTDQRTHLVWQKAPLTDTLTWEEALTYADTLSLGGNSDWRLPNIKELQSINDESLINPSLSTTYFTVSGANKYWSSTTLPNQTSKAWYLSTQFGITTYDAKTRKHPIICVRGNQLVLGATDFLKTDCSVFPNPFSNQIRLKNKSGKEQFVLTNSIGQVVYTGNAIEQQNFSMLAKGIYFLKIYDQKVASYKLIKE